SGSAVRSPKALPTPICARDSPTIARIRGCRTLSRGNQQSRRLTKMASPYEKNWKYDQGVYTSKKKLDPAIDTTVFGEPEIGPRGYKRQDITKPKLPTTYKGGKA